MFQIQSLGKIEFTQAGKLKYIKAEDIYANKQEKCNY